MSKIFAGEDVSLEAVVAPQVKEKQFKIDWDKLQDSATRMTICLLIALSTYPTLTLGKVFWEQLFQETEGTIQSRVGKEWLGVGNEDNDPSYLGNYTGWGWDGFEDFLKGIETGANKIVDIAQADEPLPPPPKAVEGGALASHAEDAVTSEQKPKAPPNETVQNDDKEEEPPISLDDFKTAGVDLYSGLEEDIEERIETLDQRIIKLGKIGAPRKIQDDERALRGRGVAGGILGTAVAFILRFMSDYRNSVVDERNKRREEQEKEDKKAQRRKK